MRLKFVEGIAGKRHNHGALETGYDKKIVHNLSAIDVRVEFGGENTEQMQTKL